MTSQELVPTCAPVPPPSCVSCMNSTTPTPHQSHTLRIASLTWPILIGQLALIANGVFDTVMVARFSAMDLAALALGVSIYVDAGTGFAGTG